MYHGSQTSLSTLQKEGFRVFKKSSHGEFVSFTDNPQFTKSYSVDPNNLVRIARQSFNLKQINSRQEEVAFVQSMDARNLSEAIRKEGKYDGFIIPNSGLKESKLYGITNLRKLNEHIK